MIMVVMVEVMKHGNGNVGGDYGCIDGTDNDGDYYGMMVIVLVLHIYPFKHFNIMSGIGF